MSTKAMTNLEAIAAMLREAREEGYAAAYFAVKDDKPLTPEQVKRVWDDAFLTNIIVPILEHIKRHDDEMVSQAIEDEDVLGQSYYSRRMVDLDHVQDIVREWRG